MVASPSGGASTSTNPVASVDGVERFFNPATKCCTYHPRLPNFLVGALLSDATRSMAAAPIQVFDTPRATPAESPGASVAGVDSLGGSLIGTLTLAPELERRNPLLARQCKAAFARLADAPVYADAPLMHSMSEAQRQIELTLARGEAIAVLVVVEFSAGSFAMISTVVHEQRSRLLAGLEYLNL